MYENLYAGTRKHPPKRTFLTVVRETGTFECNTGGVQLAGRYLDWIIEHQRESAGGAIRNELSDFMGENFVVSFEFHLNVVGRTDRVGAEHAETD